MNPVPKSIRRLVLAERVVLSSKASRRLFEDGFSIEDLRESLLSGVVTKKEQDERKIARYKYIIEGPSLSGRTLYSCGKIVKDEKGRDYFLLTAHEAEKS